MKMKKSLLALLVASAAVSAHAAPATLPTEPFVVDGYTPDARSVVAKQTYANRVVTSDVQGNNHSVFGQDNTVDSLHGSSSVYGNQNVVGPDAKDGNIFGDGSSITGYQSQAVGDNNRLVGEQNTGIGMNNIVNGNHTHAIGGGNNVTGDQSLATGHYNLITGANAVAVGYDNKALKDDTTVVGSGAKADGLNAGAFGSKATATGESALALGTGANATADSTVAIGNDSNATGKSSVAVGESTNATGVFATALGDSATATGNRTIAVSVDAKAKADESIAVGSASTSEGIRSIAIGANATATNESATVVGTHSTADIRGTVIGAESQAYNHGFAGGYQAKATGESSTAIGVRANSTGLSTIAVGSDATANKIASTAIGQGAKAEANYTVALGKAAVATHGSSVALGTATTTKQAVSVTTATVGKLTYGGFAGTDATAVVSVGQEGDHTRQIVNMGAGEISATSTDAINGSQLYATNDVLNNAVTSVVNVLGGDAATDNKGNITMTNIGGTGENTVHDAIKLVHDGVKANAANITVNAGNIALNKAEIAKNAGNIQINADAIKANADKIAANTVNITKNANDIVDLTKRVTTNEGNIASNTNRISTLEKQLPEVEAGENVEVATTTDANGKKTFTVSTKKEVSFDKVTTGDVVIDKDNGINAGNKVISNVKEGVKDTDAVNVSQLKVVDAKANKNANDINDLTGRVTTNEGNINTNKDNIAKNATAIENNGKAIAKNTTRIDTLEKQLPETAAGDNITVTTTTDANGKKTYTVATAKDVNFDTVTVGDVVVGKDGINAGNQTIVNVKDGVNGTDAVNVNQLKAVDNKANQNAKGVAENKQAIAAIDKRHSVVEQGKNTKVTSRKGDNGETIYTVSTTDDLTVKSVTFVDGPVINKDGINANNTKVTNVKEGVADTDAVNVAQLNRVKATVNGNTAKINKLNTRVDGLDRDVRKNRKRADAGTAAVAAMANIPQVYLPGKSGVGVGVGYKHGQSALAVGYSQTSDNSKHIIKLSAGVDTQKDVTVGAGYMYQW